MQKSIKFIVSLLFIVSLTPNIFGEQIFTDNILKNRFGYSIEQSNEFLIVGARDSTISSITGKAYIYALENGEWVFDQELIPSEAAGTFGRSVSISYPYAIAGAGDKGAFIFEHKAQSWVQVAHLFGQIAGEVVSISGDIVMVADPYHRVTNSNNNGSVFAFHRDGNQWVKKQEIAPTSMEYDQFGHALSVHNDNLIISGNDKNDKGYAFIYYYDGTAWVKEAQLSSNLVRVTFGVDVDISDDYAVVGASVYAETALSPLTNAIFIYKLMTHTDLAEWGDPQILTNSDTPLTGHEFGYALNFSDSGNLLIVGARGKDKRRGAAYIYRNENNTWVKRGKVAVKNARESDNYGHSVCISEKKAVIGGPCEEILNENEGHVASFSNFIKDNVNPDPSSDSGSSGGCFIHTLFR